MQRRRTKRLLTATTAALVAGMIVSAVPASAACVSAEASYRLQNQSEKYVLGPKACVVSTPWQETLTLGTPPAGAGVPGVLIVEGRVWIPSP